MTTDPTAPDPTAPAADPWARWGWLMGAVWVVFLLFPVASVLDARMPPVVTAVALAGIALFAVVYVVGFARMIGDGASRRTGWLLVALVLIAGAEAVVIDIEALGMAPFIVSFAMFGLRWPVGAIVAAAAMVAALLLVVVSGDEGLEFFVVLLPIVFGLTLLVRVLEHYGQRHERAARELALVSERERVARDVHDVLGHSLTAISVKAELAARLLESDRERAATELAQVQDLARDALAEIRSTVAGLRATRLGDEVEVARDALSAAGIEAELPRDVDVVEVAHRIVLAWALREAVTNVVRHSRARRCVVTLGPDSLVVADDGVGPTGGEGNGLRGLRERVDASGGTVTLGPGAGGRGHELRVQL